MTIRTRLILLFTFVVASLLIVSSFAIYYPFENYRASDFYSRIRARGTWAVRFIADQQNLTPSDINLIGRNSVLIPLPEEKIIISDLGGTILFSTSPGSTGFNRELLQNIEKKKHITYEKGRFQVVGFFYHGVFRDCVVYVEAFDKYGLNKAHNLRLILVVVCFVGVLSTMVLGWFFAGQVLKPISAVVNQVEEISETSLNLRLDEGNGNDEIAQLTATFNKMLSRLESAFIMQRSFVSHASHELRTPLTVLRGQVEVSLLRHRSVQEYETVLKSLLDELDNLSDLVNGLLELANVNLDFAVIKFRDLRIDEILWQAKTENNRNNPACNVTIAFEESAYDASRLVVKGNENLLKSCFLNLISNSCKYSSDRSSAINISTSESYVFIEFSDTGIGIPKEDLKNVFTPFFRSENANDIRGHGLGLSLVDRIVNLHEGQIDIRSEYNKGTTVTIRLPSEYS